MSTTSSADAAPCPPPRKRVAIVTGGTRGIGRGVATQLAASGDISGLVLTYNTNQEAADRVAAELQSETLRVVTVGGDLSSSQARKAVFDCCDNHFLQSKNTDTEEGYDLCLLVHNAGQIVGVTADNVEGMEFSTTRKKFGDGSLMNDETGTPDLSLMRYYQKLYGEGFVELCEYAAVRMKVAQSRSLEAGTTCKYRGSIIGISSPGCNHSFRVTAGYDMPGSGKSLMEFSCRMYALQLASLGINVNVIIPGFTKSDAWGKIAEQRGMPSADGFLDQLKGNVPCGEIAQATDIGDTVVFLAGSGGGRFITGLSLRVDGGLHLK